MSGERLITNVRKQGPAELALVYQENAKGKVESERISPFYLIFDAKGNPNFNYSTERLSQKAEVEGMRSMWELAQERRFVVWASPKGGPEKYKEGRLVVGEVIQRGRETIVDCRGIPILSSGEELKAMIDNLLSLGAVSMDEITDVESLRSEALGIDCGSKYEFWDLCERVFGNSEVWNNIRHGVDIADTKVKEKVVVEVMQDMVVRGVHDPYYFEIEMRHKGYEIVAGNHGGVSDLPAGAFDSMYAKLAVHSEVLDKNLKQCETCGWYFIKNKIVCPKCKV